MILESLLTGGGTGILGSIFSNIADIWKQRQERKHKIEMRKLDMEAMDKEFSFQERQAEIEGETAMAESADDLRESSYQHDARKYSEGFDIKSMWLKAPLIFVDTIRGLVRPALTGYLIYVVYTTRLEVAGIIKQAGGLEILGPEYAMEIYQSIVSMLLYLAAVTVTWWFGTRPIKKSKV